MLLRVTISRTRFFSHLWVLKLHLLIIWILVHVISSLWLSSTIQCSTNTTLIDIMRLCWVASRIIIRLLNVRSIIIINRSWFLRRVTNLWSSRKRFLPWYLETRSRSSWPITHTLNLLSVRRLGLDLTSLKRLEFLLLSLMCSPCTNSRWWGLLLLSLRLNYRSYIWAICWCIQIHLLLLQLPGLLMLNWVAQLRWLAKIATVRFVVHLLFK